MDIPVIDQEAVARDWAKRHMEFINPNAELLKIKEVKMATFICKFCPREFVKEGAMHVHQSQCKQNPNAKQWQRTNPKPRGAQPGNQSARKYAAVEIPHKVGQEGGGTNNVAETVLVMWNKYLVDADETKNINQLSRDFLKKLINGEVLK